MTFSKDIKFYEELGYVQYFDLKNGYVEYTGKYPPMWIDIEPDTVEEVYNGIYRKDTKKARVKQGLSTEGLSKNPY